MTKIACIGAGYWGKNLIRNFAQLNALHTICDANNDALSHFSKLYPKCKMQTDVVDVLHDFEVEAVCIATPAETHAQLIEQALVAGKHVYVEKPLCLDENQSKQLILLAQSKKRILMVGHLLQYHPIYIEIKRLLAQGEIGALRYLYSNRLNMGLLRNEENALWSFAPHDISMILGLVDAMPEQLQAHGASYLTDSIEDHCVGLLQFKGKVKAHIYVSWLHPSKEQKLVVVGEKAMLVFDDTQPWEKKLARYNHDVEWQGSRPVAIKAEPEWEVVPQSEPLKNECQHFIDCVQEGKTPISDGEEGLRVLTVLNQLQAAMMPEEDNV